MAHPGDLKISDYSYELPTGRIAQRPLPSRDASKLLIYRDHLIEESVYSKIAAEIPSNSLVVFNQTRVIHARLLFQKLTGGTIEIFCLEPGSIYPDITTAMLQKKSVQWLCMVGGASKWKNGMTLRKEVAGIMLSADILERRKEGFLISLSWDQVELSFADVLQQTGAVPLPPYMDRDATVDDDERYQTIFAREEGSVAAPTAGLHFTERILEDLAGRNVTIEHVTLHVGAGTFQPVKSETMAEHPMHAEWIEVKLETVNTLISHLEQNIVAVGTTSLRTLESLYWIGVKLLNGILPDFKHIAVSQWEPYELEEKSSSPGHALKALADWMIQNHQEKIITKTQIIIAPGYTFKLINALVTNFHQPHSTLLLLVAALIGGDWRKVYEYALNNDYRFLSYGDGSLLWRKDANDQLNLIVKK